MAVKGWFPLVPLGQPDKFSVNECSQGTQPLTKNTSSGDTRSAGELGGDGGGCNGPIIDEAGITGVHQRLPRRTPRPSDTVLNGRVSDVINEEPGDWGESDSSFRLVSSDDINNPAHYTKGPIECIEAIESAAEGWPNWIAPLLANATKYTWRSFQKGKALRDLRKARWYIDRAIAATLKKGYVEE